MRIIDLTQPLSLSHLRDRPHSGTHVDAPAYLFQKGKTIDRFAPESFLRDAVLLDITNAGAGEQIDDEDLEAAEEEAGLAVREGEAVILHTDWSKTEQGEQYPFLSQNGAEYLEFKRAGVVGVDTPNVDSSMNTDSPAHSVLLRSEILVLEGLCNLNLVEVERFRLIALPLKTKGPCSPVRAVALVD